MVNFCPYRRFVPRDVLSHGCYVSGCFFPMDVLSARCFFCRTLCLTDVLSVQMFCPAGCFVPPDVLSLQTFCPFMLCHFSSKRYILDHFSSKKLFFYMVLYKICRLHMCSRVNLDLMLLFGIKYSCCVELLSGRD